MKEEGGQEKEECEGPLGPLLLFLKEKEKIKESKAKECPCVDTLQGRWLPFL